MSEHIDPADDSGYRVQCDEHGAVPLSHDQYAEQLDEADAVWLCPICNAPGTIIEPEDEDGTKEEAF